MHAFGAYARHYDLLYGDKDYQAEAGFVAGVLEGHLGPSAGLRLLDLGCGTGRHARPLARRGHQVLGVDLSAEMIARAAAEADSEPAEVRARLQFTRGDLRSFRGGGTFDGVLSLFHVMSYQVTLADLEAALATARAHLRPGGVFLFDAWYGPGVLRDPPAVRVKRVGDDAGSILRLSEPTLLVNENRVDVAYTVFDLDPAGAVTGTTREVHRLRYWFHPEIAAAADRGGFELLELSSWMARTAPTANSWNGWWALRAR